MDKEKKSRTGGLLKDLAPNCEIKLRDSQYVVKNVGLYPIRIRVYVNCDKQFQNEEKSRIGGNKLG